ncbi:MAG TPA: protein kinase [Polyangiaceae bacterium]
MSRHGRDTTRGGQADGPAIDDRPTLPSSGTPLDDLREIDKTLVSEGDAVRSTRVPRVVAPQLFGAGRFEVLECLGTGGMGVVYAVVDRNSGERVALKTLHDLDGGSIRRLKGEFRSLASVVHPNLIRLRELYADGSEVFFTMDLVAGRSLSAFLDGAAGTAERLTTLRDVFRQIALGLASIHENEKIHRDLKPSNVMVRADGRALILDFGVACDSGRAQGLVTADAVAGTPAYMSPEQALGREMSPASDWYAFGTMLYEALVGRLPFEGTLLELLSAKTSRDAPALAADAAPADLALLAQELLARSPERRPSAREVLSRLGLEAPVEVDLGLPPMSSRLAGFVGRESELVTLEGVFYRALQGERVNAIVSGASGIGKTTLVHEFLSDDCAAKGALVLESKCFEHESVRYNALDGIVDGLQSYLGRLPPETRARLTPRHARSLTTLFPALGDVLARDAPGGQKLPEQPGERRRLGFHALRELLGRVGEQVPLVLFLDDLQWGDEDSGRLLSVVLAPPDPPALLLIAACRSDERQHSRLLHVLDAAGPGVWQPVEIDVGALEDDEALKMTERLLGDRRPELARAVVAEARGSPFFLWELALAARQSGRELRGVSVADLIVSRVQGLPGDARNLLEVLALSEVPVTQRVAEAALGRGPFADAWLALKRAKLVRALRVGEDERIQCYHDRIGETVALSLAPARAAELHRGMALALEREPSAESDRLAEHFRRGGEPERAGIYAERAGDTARAGLAFTRAASWYALALDLASAADPRRRRLRIALAEALEDAGQARDAALHYQSAAAEADDPTVALDLRRRAASQLLGSGHADEGTAVLNEVLRAAGLDSPSTTAGALLGLVWERAALTTRGLAPAARSSAASPAELLRVDALAAAASGYMRCDFIRGAMFASKELRFALATGDVTRVARGLANEIVYAANEGSSNAERVRALRARAERMLAEVSDPRVLGYMKIAFGASQLLIGESSKAVPELREAQRVLSQGRSSWELTFARFLYGLGVQICGGLIALDREAEAWLDDARERNDLQAQRYFATFRAFSLLGLDRPESAHEELTRALAATEKASNDFIRFGALHAFVLIALYQRAQPGVFEPLLAEHEKFWRSPLRGGQLSRIYVKLYVAFCLLVRAEHAPRAERDLGAVRRAAKGLISEGAAYARGHGNMTLAAAHVLEGQPERAVPALAEASALFASVGQHVPASAAAYQRGRLLGGDEGNALVDRAVEALERLEIANPERMIEAYSAGFWSR